MAKCTSCRIKLIEVRALCPRKAAETRVTAPEMRSISPFEKLGFGLLADARFNHGSREKTSLLLEFLLRWLEIETEPRSF